MNINFLNINSPIYTKNSQYTSAVTFCANKDLKTDRFECSNIGKEQEPINDNWLKKVNIKNDKSGTNVEGYIYKSTPSQYILKVDGETKCIMNVLPQDDYLYIHFISRINDTKNLKGLGTELLKFACLQSEALGMKGKLKLCAAASCSFYYKNNFRIPKHPVAKLDHSNEELASIDYAIRTNTEPKKINSIWEYAPIMILDEKGAKDLVKDIRWIDNSKSGILYSKKIQGKNYDMDFCDFGDEFVLQLINKDNENSKQEEVLEGKISEGKLIPQKKSFSNKEFEFEFNNALELASNRLSE